MKAIRRISSPFLATRRLCYTVNLHALHQKHWTYYYNLLLRHPLTSLYSTETGTTDPHTPG